MKRKECLINRVRFSDKQVNEGEKVGNLIPIYKAFAFSLWLWR